MTQHPATSDADAMLADTMLAGAIAEATRRAVEELRALSPGPFCVFALITSGEALRPYLGVTLHGPGRWDLPDSPFAIVGDEHLSELEPLFDGRGDLHTLPPQDAEQEFQVRLASMEEALRALDGQGLFGVGQARDEVLLLVFTMPPDESDAGFATRLNPPGPLLSAWLEAAAEGQVAPS